MKINYFKPVFIFLTIALLCMGRQQQALARPQGELTLQVFYNSLSPYGDWIYEDRYGYVWVPSAEDGFHPYYTNGYWEMTVYGNTWVSLYPWGWAAFHYGRWIYDPFYGWVWVPGYQWAPAWVCWRHGNSFYGWAPLGPRFAIGVGFGSYACPDNWWVFTPHKYVYGPRYSRHYYRNTGRERIQNSTIIDRTGTDGRTNTLYPAGPSAEDVRATTGRRVTVMQAQDVPSADQARPTNAAVRLYRPLLDEKGAAQQGRPQKFENAPRPIRDNQPVEFTPGNVPEYRKAPTRQAPGNINRDIPRQQENQPIRTPRVTEPPRTPNTLPDNKRTRPARPAEPAKQTPVRVQPSRPATAPSAPQSKPAKPNQRQ